MINLSAARSALCSASSSLSGKYCTRTFAPPQSLLTVGGIAGYRPRSKEMGPMAIGARKVNLDGYIHARDADEYQRLRDQARMWQSATEAVLDKITLASG